MNGDTDDAIMKNRKCRKRVRRKSAYKQHTEYFLGAGVCCGAFLKNYKLITKVYNPGSYCEKTGTACSAVPPFLASRSSAHGPRDTTLRASREDIYSVNITLIPQVVH